MKSLILLTGGFTILAVVADAQRFTLQPQVGLEHSRSMIRVNDKASLSSVANSIAPSAGLRLNAKITKLHGAFIGVSTNSSPVEYRFSTAETIEQNHTISNAGLRMTLQAGYQYTSKRISLGKASAHKSDQKPSYNRALSGMSGSRCGAYSSRCGMARMKQEAEQKSKAKNWYMSVQPSIGAAFVPTVSAMQQVNVVDGKNEYTYTAANWRTAIVTGVAFQFSRKNDQPFTVGINYLKGIGKFGTETIETTNGLKTTPVNFRSSASSWNLSFGVPISLSKSKPEVKARPEVKNYYYKSKCQRYKVI
ncbi:hypothetical protein EXU57_05505 [Segetibacter sp. 3557_3]|uniref:hypothetical protein n=1 Tax=Segetibacter sp. 3557_3 TaxID=2547429 RepID=UPI00105900ED|nr:hypothetical protein [Segetibacter sp. 3557_3]TDH27923.1 hypothetical protein EXU57_05505 [Segetibacter sp. 3557_3]